jgi:GNAT superfamily N-acetyltransferase
MPKPPPDALEFRLRDGTPVLIRPVVPDDKPRLKEGFSRLSEQARYRRFMSFMSDLSEDELRYLTEIDYHDHMAWLALEPTRPDIPVLGVARYVRVAAEPSVAEAAVVVGDRYQGRGLGSILLGVLATSAVRNGIHAFRAYVLQENAPMLSILHDLGATTVREPDGLVRVDGPLAEDPQDLPDTPTGRVFRAVAGKLVQLGVSPPGRNRG